MDSPIYGGDELQITIPASTLRKGQNKLLLTAVPDPENPDAESMLLYDASVSANSRCASRPTAAVKPTVFYKQGQNQLLNSPP